MSVVIDNWVTDSLRDNDRITEDLGKFLYLLTQEEGMVLGRIARLLDDAKKMKFSSVSGNQVIVAASMEAAREFLGKELPDLR